MTLPVPGSMRVMVRSAGLETQIDPSPNATRTARGTEIRAAIWICPAVGAADVSPTGSAVPFDGMPA